MVSGKPCINTMGGFHRLHSLQIAWDYFLSAFCSLRRCGGCTGSKDLAHLCHDGTDIVCPAACQCCLNKCMGRISGGSHGRGQDGSALLGAQRASHIRNQGLDGEPTRCSPMALSSHPICHNEED